MLRPLRSNLPTRFPCQLPFAMAKAAVLASALLLAGTGCNMMSGNKSVTVHGKSIGEASLGQIETGRTTASWLAAAFGEPTSKKSWDRPDGTRGEVWRYEYRRSESSSGEVLFLYDSWKHKEETRTTCFEIVSGVVTRYWVEQSP